MDDSCDMSFATAVGTPLPPRRTGSPRWTPASEGRYGGDHPFTSNRVHPVVETSSQRDLPDDHHYESPDPASSEPPLRPRTTAEPLPANTASPPSAPTILSPRPERRTMSSQSSYRDNQYGYTTSPLARSASSHVKERAREREREREVLTSPYRVASNPSTKSRSPISSPLHSPARSTSSSPSSISSPGVPRALASVSASPFPTPSQLRAATPSSHFDSSSFHFSASRSERPGFLRAGRRESSPGLNASRLGGMQIGSEESFLGAVGDRTYDELEVAVANNNRRRSFGIALRAPLPPSPDDSSFGEPQSPTSPTLSARRSPTNKEPRDLRDHASHEHSSPVTLRSAPTVRVSVDECDSVAMPPPPFPEPRAHGHLPIPSTTTQRYSPLRGSPLRGNLDNPPSIRSDEYAHRPSASSATTSSTEGSSIHSPRHRQYESVSTLGSLGGGCLMKEMKHDSLRPLDASVRWDRINRQAAASRLDTHEPDLLDAASFRLSPPSQRPSAMEIFGEMEVLGSPSVTPARIGAYSHHRLESETPRRTPIRRPIADADRTADMTVDFQQLLRGSARPKRPSGTEDSLLGPALSDLADQLADLSDGEDDVLPPGVRHHASMPPPLGHVRERERERMSVPAIEEQQEEPVSLQRTSSVRSVRSTGLLRSDSTRSITSAGTGIKRSDSVRSTTGLQRSNSTRSMLPPSSTRALPTSASVRRLAALATPGRTVARDRPDVPLSMRGRAQERATSGGIPTSISASSEDRWADAIERDVVSELKPAQAQVERRGLPSSSSSRRLNTSTTLARTSSVHSAPTSAFAARPLARTSSVRQALLAPTETRDRRSIAPQPTASTGTAGMLRNGSRPSLAPTRSAQPARGSMPPPPVPNRAMPRSSFATKPRPALASAPPPQTAAAAKRASLLAPQNTAPSIRSRPLPSAEIPKTASRPSLAVPAPGIPKSSSRPSLAPALTKSSARSSLAAPHSNSSLAPTLPKSSSRPSLATIPKSSSRPSLAPAPRARPAPTLADGTTAVNRRPAAPGAGVALPRTKLSAPPGLERIPAASRFSRPAQAQAEVPATPAGRAPRAALVPRTAVKGARPF